MTRSESLKNIVLISQLAIHVLVPTFILLFAGLAADRYLGTSFIGIVGLIFGMLGGCKSAYDLAMGSVGKKKDEDPQAIVDRVNSSEGKP